MPGPQVLTPVAIPELAKRRIGRVLTKMGRVSKEDLEQALKMQQASHKGKKVGAILMEMGKVTQRDIDIALAAQMGYEYLDLAEAEIPAEALKSLQPATANAYKVVPIAFDPARRVIRIVMKSRDNYRAVDDLKNVLGFSAVECAIAPGDQIDALLARHYGSTATAGETTKRILAEQDSAAVKAAAARSTASIDLSTLADAASDNKVVELLNHLLMQAIADKASDIHLEPFEDEFKVRYRIDGVLYEMAPVHKSMSRWVTFPISMRMAPTFFPLCDACCILR
ncbi:MAG: GspE/PulE family protein, partial [Phycisphaerales bacterium]